MSRYRKRIQTFLREENGPTATEYAVLLGLIITACITAITTLGTTLSDSYANAETEMFGG